MKRAGSRSGGLGLGPEHSDKSRTSAPGESCSKFQRPSTKRLPYNYMLNMLTIYSRRMGRTARNPRNMVVGCGILHVRMIGELKTMRGLMMDFPLTVPTLLERAGGIFGNVEIVTRRPDRRLARSTWGDLYRRSRRLANALTSLGLQRGDRVATLLWNQSEHMEAYFGVPVAGGVLHTLNLRLHPDEVTFIVNHAGDRFPIVDDVLLPVFEKFRGRVEFERVIVVPFGAGATPAGCGGYADLLAGA